MRHECHVATAESSRTTPRVRGVMLLSLNYRRRCSDLVNLVQTVQLRNGVVKWRGYLAQRTEPDRCLDLNVNPASWDQ